MTVSSETDGGCLSILSSCLTRGKTRSDISKSSQQAAASGSSTATPSKPLVLSPALSPVASHTCDAVATVTEATSSISLDLWHQAYQELKDDKTSKWIGNVIAVDSIKDSTQELVDIVRKSEDKYKDESPKLKVGNREIIWRDYAERVVSWLTVIGDIAATFAPAPSSVVWSTIKTLLNTNVSQCKDLTAILGCIDKVLCLARRGRVYEEVYLVSPSLTATQEALKQKLISTYKTCLEFLAFMDAKFKQSRVGHFFDALLDPEQGREKVSELEKLEEDLFKEADTCRTEGITARSEDLLRSLGEPLGRIDDKVTEVLENLGEFERKHALNYISKIRVGAHHAEKRKTRTKGTCQWLIDHMKFREWEESSCSSLLWLQGSIGTGKSFLSSMVIDRYRVDEGVTSKWSNQRDEAFAYFYCSRSDPDRQEISSILRSFIRQLSELPRRSGSIHKATYNLVQNRDDPQKVTGIEDYKSVLVGMINSYPRTTLILDALDECELSTRKDLAKFLKQLVKESTRLLKVFVASRKENDIERHLGSPQGPQMLVEISTSDNEGDIKKFVDSEWAEFEEDAPFPIEDGLERVVKDTLVEKSDGMFRWTYLQWEQLKRCHSNIGVKERLQELPDTLSGAYDEIYGKLKGSELLMLQRAVRWVMWARYPFDSCMLLSALRVESEKVDGDKALRVSDLVEQTLESVCRNLLVKDLHLGIWKFPHASVLEYFEAKDEQWIKNSKAEVTIVLINCMIECCSYIPSIWPRGEKGYAEYGTTMKWFRSKRTDPDNILDPRHPLQVYTHQTWLRHIYSIADDDPKGQDVVQALKRFLGENPQHPSKEYDAFCECILVVQAPHYDSARFWVWPKTHLAFGVVALGLHRVLAGWWDKDLDVSSLVKPNGQDLLGAAAFFRHAELCRDLIEAGHDPNGHADSYHHSAIGACIASRKVDLVTLLLEKGATPDRVMDGHCLLCWALMSGYDRESTPESFHLLLRAGANPNLQCHNGSEAILKCQFGCALSRAASRGDTSALEILLEKGADINLEHCRNIYGSPLVAAVAYGRLDNARLLIERGSEVSVQLKSGEFGSPLAAAVSGGHLDCVRLLTEHGADVDVYMEFGRYGSILAAAILAKSPSLEMVKYLVEEKHLDSTQLSFMNPRYKHERGLLDDEEAMLEAQIGIVAYLVQERHMDPGLLAGIGVSREALESCTMDVNHGKE